METRQLIICRGIQGSGKSTWAKQWCHEDPEHRIRFNNDDIRNMLGDYWVPNREKVVTATYNTVLAYGMEKGYNIVVDNMNLNPKTCVELEKTVKDFNENYTYDWKYEVEYKDFLIKKDSEDWRKCDYGDWSCSTWSTPRKDVEAQLEELNALGRARWELMKQYGEDSVQAKIYDDKIADAGMVAVFLLDEVLKYNPDFDYHINREWTTTLIKDFDGEINYYVDDDAHIIGVGNVNFFTTQTGF